VADNEARDADGPSDAGDLDVRIASLHVHPVKSCAGIAVPRAELAETGFDLDRTWMVVDPEGVFVSQRELPRMALVRTALKADELVLRAPGMLALHVGLDRVEAETSATVWNDTVKAWDLGALAAQWMTDFLGRPLRLVRFDPDTPRTADPLWTRRASDAPVAAAFQDAFPLLVVSRASLDALNARLAAAGHGAVGLERFRPNVVLDGLDAHDEDHVDTLAFAGADGPVVLRLVKPCVRCPIPDVDPATGESGHAVGDVLRAYRADPRMDGRVTFGMNAVVVEGFGRTLAVGATGRARYAFDA
jgi:uncharacterized protein YcbX